MLNRKFEKMAFVGGLLIDGNGNAPIENSLVLVDDKKIVYAGEQGPKTDGYKIMDIKGKTIMPGLIDTHLHFSGNLTDNDSDWVLEDVVPFNIIFITG